MSKINFTAAGILAVMFLLMLGSVWNDSATMDELAHIPAGYSYVTQFDGRLNPEHPPLLKELAGVFTRIFVNPHFPVNTPYWQNDVNGQWDQGRVFLYESGNDADKIIFWSRLPFILLTVLFGWLIFSWTKNSFGRRAALITLILFAFSPTVLAHSRYVTTDLGAAFGFFIGIITFVRFLEIPTWKNALIAGLALGLAQLLKFSLILLVPLYGILWLAWVIALPRLHLHPHTKFGVGVNERLRAGGRLLLKIAAIGAVGIALIWIAYIPLVLNYPEERQYRDAEFLLSSYPVRPLADFNLALIENPATRAPGQYLLGFLMVSQRAGGGNTGYFLGEVSAAGSRLYFPLLYLVKEPLVLHILVLMTLWFAVRSISRAGNRTILSPDASGLSMVRLRLWINKNFAEFSALAFIALYWFTSLLSPLNIGVRHVLPTFPFIYLLTARGLSRWTAQYQYANPENFYMVFQNIVRFASGALKKYFIVGVLLLIYALGAVSVFPHFLAYYNELAPIAARAVSAATADGSLPLTGLGGGTSAGWRIAVDSNYDWGQDLKRLRDFVEENRIEKISLDYFGGGNPRYYLDDKFEPWWSAKGPASGWFAVSATFRQGAFGNPAPGFYRVPQDSYEWLRQYEPVARAGYSIFIYQLP